MISIRQKISTINKKPALFYGLVIWIANSLPSRTDHVYVPVPTYMQASLYSLSTYTFSSSKLYDSLGSEGGLGEESHENSSGPFSVA